MRKLREDLTRVEENMRSELARITAQNEGETEAMICRLMVCVTAAINPQLQLCDSVLADLDEGVFLAKVGISWPIVHCKLVVSNSMGLCCVT